jgi:ankyrin repeat protein
MVRYLIEQGADPNASDSSDTYPAHYAAAYGWNDLLLLLHKCNVSMNVNNMLKTSPLFIAMIKGHLRCAQTVLQGKDVNINAKDGNGRTILHHVISNKVSSPAGCLAQLKVLINDRHADVTISDPNRDTPLHMLAAQAEHEVDVEIATLFVNAGALPDIPNAAGITPVWSAVAQGNLPLIQFFMDRNASVYTRDFATRSTPLMTALRVSLLCLFPCCFRHV